MPLDPIPILYFVLSWLGGHTIDAVIRAVKGKLPDSLPPFPPLIAPQTDLINRHSELATIRAAIEDCGETRILYFSGEGGVGKTRLLQEAGTLCRRIRIPTPPRWSGILDLYHADLHRVSLLRAALIANLEQADHYFESYQEARKHFERRREAGLHGATLEEERALLDELFLTSYQSYARNYRPIIALDTTEAVVYESDLIQRLCQLEQEERWVDAWAWLLEQAPYLENTLFLLAGRPRPELEAALRDAQGDAAGRVEYFSIGGLTRQESSELLKKLLQKAPSSVRPLQDEADRLWQLTKGRPVQLALVVELVAQNAEVAAALQAQPPDEVSGWERQLVQRLFDQDDSTRRPLFLLALARKGLSPSLLQYLIPGQSAEAYEQQLQVLHGRSVVKERPGREALFLHDALYELFDAFPPPAERLYPWYERLAEFYRRQRDNPQEEQSVRGEAAVNALYYTLRYDPRRAFENEYVRWGERAIKGHERGLDMQLRDELLRFMNSAQDRQAAAAPGLTRDHVDQDSAVRWVKRYLMRQERPRAIQVAETILALGPEPYRSFPPHPRERLMALPAEQRQAGEQLVSQADSFFWGHLLTFYGEALTYVGRSELQARLALERAIEQLEIGRPAPQDGMMWLWKRVTGRAWNTLGYLHRSHGHYGTALAAYRRALDYFNADVPDERADTLNNLAFLFALLGDEKEARQAVDRALDVRRQLAQPYPLALSDNTSGLIYALQGQPELGRHECEVALATFEELADPRGIGLACNALGVIHRRQGQGWKSDLCSAQEAIASFRAAEEYLERAATIFNVEQVTQPSVKEPLRLWEAYNELGSLFRERTALARHQGDAQAASAHSRIAREYHQKALTVARDADLHFQKADTCDDLVLLEAEQGDMVAARAWLQRTLELVPAEFTLGDDQDDQNAPEVGEAYWLVLGKAHWQQAEWGLQQLAQMAQDDPEHSSVLRNAIEHVGFAALYFERYWPGTASLRFRLATLPQLLAQARVSRSEATDIVLALFHDRSLELASLFTALGQSTPNS